MIIYLIADPKRWVHDTRYRHRMLERPAPPDEWRIVGRDPEGGVQLLACMSFRGGIVRTERVALRKVRR